MSNPVGALIVLWIAGSVAAVAVIAWGLWEAFLWLV
jgi:hypothetical protein